MVGRSWAGWCLGKIPLGYLGGGSFGRSYAGWCLGLIPLGYQGGGSVGPGRLASGPFPYGALGLGRLARGAGPGPKVPTMPPISCQGGRSSPVEKKNKFDRHIIGNSLPLKLHNFERKFL